VITKKIAIVCGARPNFMKVASLVTSMKACVTGMTPLLVHTGQHYDQRMSGRFFEELGLPQPDVHLEVGSGTHAVQTANIMVRFEEMLLKQKPALVLVVGDVNSTMACAITAKKLSVPVAHVEAGLRSYDDEMPEEINRKVTDAISDYFFVTEQEAQDNLLREGVPSHKIYFVGNVMIDTLLRNFPQAQTSDILERLHIQKGQYCLMTLHRPSNVDHAMVLKGLLKAFAHIQNRIKIVFPVHPRTIKMIDQFGLAPQWEQLKNIHQLEPVSYHEMIRLTAAAKFVLTDSGGVQEETTVLGIPCITMRGNTERPVTVTVGTNEIVGSDPTRIIHAVDQILAGQWKKGRIPDLWDGKSGERIVDVLKHLFVSVPCGV